MYDAETGFGLAHLGLGAQKLEYTKEAALASGPHLEPDLEPAEKAIAAVLRMRVQAAKRGGLEQGVVDGDDFGTAFRFRPILTRRRSRPHRRATPWRPDVSLHSR